MSKATILSISLLSALLLSTNVFWLYTFLDQAIGQKYRQQEHYENMARIAVLEKACSNLFGGMEQSAATELLQELAPEDEVFAKENHLNTTWLSLKLDASGNISDTDACQ